MTTQHSESTARADTAGDSLERLRDREAKLREKAQQLQAKAEHLERVRRVQQQRLARRVDAHQKIILGALVQKAGLDWVLDDPDGKSAQKDDDVSSTKAHRLNAKSITYDRERILAALLWLAEVSKRPVNDVITVPDWLSDHVEISVGVCPDAGSSYLINPGSVWSSERV